MKYFITFSNAKLKDGGCLTLEDKVIHKWEDIYKNVEVMRTIFELGNEGAFSKLSYRGALKLINKTLKERNEEL